MEKTSSAVSAYITSIPARTSGTQMLFAHRTSNPAYDASQQLSGWKGVSIKTSMWAVARAKKGSREVGRLVAVILVSEKKLGDGKDVTSDAS
jgi:hypothetical protein